MITAWTKNLQDPKEVDQFKNMLLGSRPVLERQKELLKEMEADLDNSETTYSVYDKPNWEFRQADNNGFRRCLKAINKLITLDQGERTQS